MIRIALACALVASPARADSELFMAGGGDFHAAAETSFHGFFLVDWRVPDLIGTGDFRLLFNSDTLDVAVERLALAEGVELGFGLRGQAIQAGLLQDYWTHELTSDDSQTFSASYASARADIKVHVAEHHSLQLELSGRQWIFGRREATGADFRLPPNTFVFEPRLRYTFWHITSGSEEWEGHRLFVRIRGIATGVEGRLDWRAHQRPWGAPLNSRNHPNDLVTGCGFDPSLVAWQWLHFGWQLHERVRWQASEWASYTCGTDDLNRHRAGGLTPWVVPIGGQPWAASLVDRMVAAETSLHILAFGRSELGVAGQGLIARDLDRDGGTDAGLRVGVSVFGDLRFGDWQIHGRFGLTPYHPRALKLPFSLVIAVGSRVF